jgi:hypothetical protein
MALSSNIYDFFYDFYRMIDWSDPELTKTILINTVLSMFGTFIILFFIPINYLVWICGVYVFLSYNSFLRAISITIKKSNYLPVVAFKEKVPYIDIVLFENQRWWVGPGWLPVLLPLERKAWSDSTGTRALSHKNDWDLLKVEELYKTGKSLEWADSDWKVVKTEYSDANGWEYTNSRWQNPKNYRSLTSFTRKRKYSRRVKLSLE